MVNVLGDSIPNCKIVLFRKLCILLMSLPIGDLDVAPLCESSIFWTGYRSSSGDFIQGSGWHASGHRPYTEPCRVKGFGNVVLGTKTITYTLYKTQAELSSLGGALQILVDLI